MLKLSCKKTVELLSDFLDNEVSAELRTAIEHHLHRCHRCTIVFDTTRQALRIVSSTEPFEVPLDVRGRLYARLQEMLGR
jgi:predicted anti-sigma-YlaC factor YlaD